jgi:hypothetical protein
MKQKCAKNSDKMNNLVISQGFRILISNLKMRGLGLILTQSLRDVFYFNVFLFLFGKSGPHVKTDII